MLFELELGCRGSRARFWGIIRGRDEGISRGGWRLSLERS